MISFLPLVVSMTTGLPTTPPEWFELSRSLRANIRLPHGTPYVFSGLKISIAQSVIGATVPDFVAAETSIGYSFQFSTSMVKLTQAWVGLVAMSLLLFRAENLT